MRAEYTSFLKPVPSRHTFSSANAFPQTLDSGRPSLDGSSIGDRLCEIHWSGKGKIGFPPAHGHFCSGMKRVSIVGRRLTEWNQSIPSEMRLIPYVAQSLNRKAKNFKTLFWNSKPVIPRASESEGVGLSSSEKEIHESESIPFHTSLYSIEQGANRKAVIHPSAYVHPNAVIMEGVEIGPFCTVGQNVTLSTGVKMYPSSHVFGNTMIGERTVIMSGAIVGDDIPGSTRIGSDNRIGHYAVVGVKCQDLKYQEGSECFLEIGNGNDIREYSGIHRSSKPSDSTVIGDRNLIMGSCHIAHDCKIGNRNILANGTLLAGHVVVQDFTHTGGATAVHQFCHIGSYSFLAGGAMVAQDVPIFTLVSGDRAELKGLNSEGLRRCGFSQEQISALRKAYQKLFLNVEPDSTLEERMLELENNEEILTEDISKFIASIRASFSGARRGICKYR